MLSEGDAGFKGKRLAGGVLKIHFLQNTYYYLSITYKFLKKWAFCSICCFSQRNQKIDFSLQSKLQQCLIRVAVISMEQSDREIYFITRHLKNN